MTLTAAGGEAFFIPNITRGKTQETYDLIRADTETRTGQSVSGRRIASLACRRGGKDCEEKVGGRDALADRIVVAIFDLGRNVYAIRFAELDRPTDWALAEPIVIGKNQVYSVTEFPI